MTLIETVVTFIIAGILIAATGALIITGLNLFQDTAARNLDKQIGDSVLDIARKNLEYSTDIYSAPFTSTTYLDEIDISEGAIYTSADGDNIAPGKLYLKKPGDTESTDVFSGDSFYSDRKVGLSYYIKQPEEGLPVALTINVQVYDGDKITYKTSTSIQLINMTVETDPEGGLLDTTDYLAGEEWTNSIIVYTPVE